MNINIDKAKSKPTLDYLTNLETIKKVLKNISQWGLIKCDNKLVVNFYKFVIY